MSKQSALAAAVTTAPVTGVTTMTATPEPKLVEEVKESAPDELVSSRIAQIAKKEARYQEEMNKFKQERESFMKEKTEFEPLAKQWKEFQELKSKDPVAAIKHLGLSDTDFINFVAAQEDTSTPEEKARKIVDAEIAKFRQEQEQEKQKTVQERHTDTITGFKKNIDVTVKTNNDKLEFCNFYGEAAQDLIFETVNTAFQEDLKENPDATPMTAMEAAELVEQYYEDQWKQMGGLKKAKPETKVEEPVAKKEEPLKAEVSPGRPIHKTLTNRVAPSTPAAAPERKMESREQKRQRLIDALRSGTVTK